MGRTSEYRIKDTESFGLCPKCGKQMSVIDSRKSPNGYLRRRRKCMHRGCEFRLTTVEITKDDYDILKRAAEELPIKLAAAIAAIYEAREAIAV